MKAAKLIVPLACALGGFGVGAFVYPGPYTYGEVKGVHTRVNRITGVEQYASSKGWVGQRELIQESMSAAFGGFGDGLRSMGSPSSGAPSVPATAE